MAVENENKIKQQKIGASPGSLDIYKQNPRYQLKQKIRWMTPKRKMMIWLLPLVVAVAGLAVYFILAASGDPQFSLSPVNGTYSEGEEFALKVLLDTNTANNSARTGVVAVQSVLNYNSSHLSVTGINTSNSAFSQVISTEAENGVISIVLAEPTPGVSSDDVEVATLIFKALAVNTDVNTNIKFDLSQSAVVYDGGDSSETDAGSTSGYNYTIEDSSSLPPTQTCADLGGLECASGQECVGSWIGDPIDLCCDGNCRDPLPGRADFYLISSATQANTCEQITVDVMMNTGADNITILVLELLLPDIFDGIDDNSINANTRLGLVDAGGSGDKANIRIENYQNQPGTVKLATITLRAADKNDEGTITFANIDITTSGGVDVNVGETKGESYKVIYPRVKIDGDIRIDIFENSADFSWKTIPAAKCDLYLNNNIMMPSENSAVMEHSFRLDSLDSGTRYNYSVNCVADCYQESNPNRVPDSFTTLNTVDLSIQGLLVSNVKSTSADISWTTNKPADSVVYYWKKYPTSSPILKKEIKNKYITSHLINLFGLEQDSEYVVVASSVVSGGENFRITPDKSVLKACINRVSSGENCASELNTSDLRTKKANEEPDANIVLKVRQDRTCDQWLYCQAAAQMANNNQPPEIDEVCFSMGVCDQLNEVGQCIHSPDVPDGELTFEHSSEVDKISNLSGYSKVGLDWGYRCLNTGEKCGFCSNNNNITCSSDVDCSQLGGFCEFNSNSHAVCSSEQDTEFCVSAAVNGYYSYSEMKEVGDSIRIPNGNFEDGTTRPWRLKDVDSSWGTAFMSNVVEGTNRVLKIEPRSPSGTWPGVYAEGLSSRVNLEADYVVSFRARTDDPNGQDIVVELGPFDKNGGDEYVKFEYYDFNINDYADIIKLDNYWQEYVLRLDAGSVRSLVGSGIYPLNLTIARHKDSYSDESFYIDNILMHSVLEVADNATMVPRSCRLYPSSEAPACDYYSSNRNEDYSGWKGYCVEQDPGYPDRKYASQAMCLQWWPVDIIRGEGNIFSNDEVVGYSGKKPLYYCLEAEGNYKRTDLDLGICRGPSYDDVYTDDPEGEVNTNEEKDDQGNFPKFPIWEDKDLNTETSDLCHRKINLENCKGNCKWYKINAEADNYMVTYKDFYSIYGNSYTSYMMPNLQKIRRAGGIPTNERRYILYPWTEYEEGKSYNKISKDAVAGVIIQSRDWYLEGSLLENKYDIDIDDSINLKVKHNSGDEQGLLSYYWLSDSDDLWGDVWEMSYTEGKGSFDSVFDVDECRDDSSGGEGNMFGLRLIFNPRSGVLENIRAMDCDDKNGNNSSPGLDDQLVDLTLILREPCMKIVKVVDEDGYTTAWTDRIKSDSININSWLGYERSQPSSPYGAAIVPSNDWDPEKWRLIEPLYVEPVSSLGLTSSFSFGSNFDGSVEYNAGAPYGVYDYDNAVDLRINRGNTEFFGPPVCLSGQNKGKYCPDGDKDCGIDMDTGEYGMCVGLNTDFGDETDEGLLTRTNEFNKKIFKLDNNTYKSASVDNLSQLFARSMDIYEWKQDRTDNTFKYMKTDESWDITNQGVLPRVDHILVQDTDEYSTEIIEQGAVVMKFSSWVHPDQQPLVRYTVDWGDGHQATEAGLRIKGRTVVNPHIVVNYYKYDSSYDDGNGRCVFRPKIQIEDNWGRCNGSGKCSEDNAWTEFGKEVIVYRDAASAPGASLSVNKTELVYLSNAQYFLPYSHSFVVANEGVTNSSLEWYISSIEDFRDENGVEVTNQPDWELSSPGYNTPGYPTITNPMVLGGQRDSGDMFFTIKSAEGLGGYEREQEYRSKITVARKGMMSDFRDIDVILKVELPMFLIQPDIAFFEPSFSQRGGGADTKEFLVINMMNQEIVYKIDLKNSISQLEGSIGDSVPEKCTSNDSSSPIYVFPPLEGSLAPKDSAGSARAIIISVGYQNDGGETVFDLSCNDFLLPIVFTIGADDYKEFIHVKVVNEP